MQNIINKLFNFRLFEIYAEMTSSLSETQIWILIIVTLLLVSLLIYRWMGAGVFFVFLFVLMIVYLVYRANIVDFYETQNEEFDSRMKAIQVEIDSSKPETINNTSDSDIPVGEATLK